MTTAAKISGTRVRVPVFWDRGMARSVSDAVITGLLPLPKLPADVREEWCRRADDRVQSPGDIALVRGHPGQFWPGSPHVADATRAWAKAQGVSVAGLQPEPDAFACLGAFFHTDLDGFPGEAFCVVWCTEDAELDLVLPAIGKRVPLHYGTVVIFDGCQPHGVLGRRCQKWDPDRYYEGARGVQLFLSWQLSLEEPELRALPVQTFEESQSPIWPCVDGHPADVDLVTGAWVAR